VGRPLGQHFLFDKNILRKIVKSSGVTGEDTVVEIGAGIGTLTEFLSGCAKRVIAIEVDKGLVGRLKERLSEKENVEIINADALRYPYDEIKGDFKVVSNIPYNITTPLLFKLLEYRRRIITMTLLLQKEVALRIVAQPNNKDYSPLSISIQLYTRPRIIFYVSRKAFSPPPDVDSALVHFEVSPEPLFEIGDEELFMRIVKKTFSHRRKMILNSLRGFSAGDDLPCGEGEIKAALIRAGIDPSSRPDSLTIEDFARLTEAIRS
jgi:16S rRNA (adenine1518-N6/adenine1519-N6)-dimethyltransferase